MNILQTNLIVFQFLIKKNLNIYFLYIKYQNGNGRLKTVILNKLINNIKDIFTTRSLFGHSLRTFYSIIVEQ